MTTVYALDTHDQVLPIIRALGRRGVSLAHLDFHDDMRGLLIDRDHGHAYVMKRMESVTDCGNWLARAVASGWVSSVTWVHNTPGGRRDDVGTCSFTDDLSVKIGRRLLLADTDPIEFTFRELEYGEWTGVGKNEWLDMDWDFFASSEYTRRFSRRLIGNFYELAHKRSPDGLGEYIPEVVFLTYSAGWSRSSYKEFIDFVGKTAEFYSAKIVTWGNAMSGAQMPAEPNLGSMIEGFLHRRNIY